MEKTSKARVKEYKQERITENELYKRISNNKREWDTRQK